MEPILNINILTYILALGFLGLWFLLTHSRKWSVILGMLFFISLLSNFIVTVGFATGPMKFFYFSNNLLLIGLSGFIFNLVRQNRIALLATIIGSILVSLQIFSIDLPGKLIPAKFQTVSEYGELLIIPHSASSLSELIKAIQPYSGRLIPAFHPKTKGTLLDDFYIIDIPDDLQNIQEEILQELRKSNIIEYGELNDRVQVEPVKASMPRKNISDPLSNDPLVKEQWAFSTLQFDQLYKTIISRQDQIRKKIKVAVLDTGIEGDHEDLRQHMDKKYHTEKDPVGHGTHCAGIIAAETNNKIGIASMAFYDELIELVPVKVLNSFGFGTQVQIINGMIRAIDEGADILSMSLGAPSDHPKQKAYTAAVQYALDHNAVVVTSAGNSSSKASMFSPGNVSGVICVTATDSENQLAEFSNYLDPEVKWGIAAPGVQILSTYKGGKYKSLSGTSMSAPFVSAAAAILKAFDPDLTAEEIYQMLHDTSLPLSSEGKSGRLLQPDAALQSLLARKKALQ